MKQLQVTYNGWGERWPLGTLADIGKAIVFEYAPQAVERGLALSSIHYQLPCAGATAQTVKRIFCKSLKLAKSKSRMRSGRLKTGCLRLASCGSWPKICRCGETIGRFLNEYQRKKYEAYQAIT